MTPFGLFFGLVLLVAQFALPRRFAFLPLLIAATHLSNLPMVEVGVSFSICRILILAGLIRAAGTNTRLWSSRNPLDVLMLIWAGWTVLSTIGHNPPDCNPLTIRLGLACDLFGAYLYARAYLTDQQDFQRFCKCLALALVPLALLLFAEQIGGRNLYTVVGGFGPEVRAGRVRAQGPFAHAILAGTVGGVCLPLVLHLVRRCKWRVIVACLSCGIIVLSSASSGPILTVFATIGAMALWRWRPRMRLIRTGVVLAIVGLALMMKAPVWYLMARIDLTGSSTGWHRAQLVTEAVNRIGDWWLVGTDYTRDWMPYGIGWSKNQVDITNYFLQMGVVGGLPLMLLFIGVLFKAFQFLGRGMNAMRKERNPAEFMLWCAGVSLFAHCVTFLSISYFDQSYVFLFLVIGAVPGLVVAHKNRPVKAAAKFVKNDSDAAPLPGVNDHPQPA